MMRKEIIIGLVLAFILLVTPFSVKAQNTNSAPGNEKRIEAQQKVEEKKLSKEQLRAEIQQRVEERKASNEAKIALMRQERIRNHWGILEKRISATIARIDILIARIESRLAKISGQDPDLDVAGIESQIAEAKELTAYAKLMLNEASDSMDNLALSEDPKTDFENLRETVKGIKDVLVEAHRILVHVIGDIRGLRVGNENVAPTLILTPTTTELTPSPILTPTPETSPTTVPEEGV